MRRKLTTRFGLGFALAVGLSIALQGPRASAGSSLALASARITIAGNSNIHPYTASTSAVRLTGVQIAALEGDIWEAAQRSGTVERFEIAIPAASLTSPREGLDKNMHKALKVKEHPDITFRLIRIEPGANGAPKAVGLLRITGVEREIALDLKTERLDSTLKITGEAQLLMTDYGIKPPTAMLGMLKTDPKVTVTFETVLANPLS